MTNARRLRDRVYVVTGATSVIGRAAALRIAAEGGGVVLADLNEESLRGTAATIEESGGRYAVLAGDVTDPEHPVRAVGLAQAEFEWIDGCVPAAGMLSIRSITEVRREEWETIVGLNLTSVFCLDREVAEVAMTAGPGGAIVNFSFTSAHGDRPNNVDYGGSKLGLDYATRTLAAHQPVAKVTSDRP